MPHLHGIERIFDRRKILTRHFVHMSKLFNIFGLSIHTELTVTIVRRFTIYSVLAGNRIDCYLRKSKTASSSLVTTNPRSHAFAVKKIRPLPRGSHRAGLIIDRPGYNVTSILIFKFSFKRLGVKFSHMVKVVQRERTK